MKDNEKITDLRVTLPLRSCENLEKYFNLGLGFPICKINTFSVFLPNIKIFNLKKLFPST